MLGEHHYAVTATWTGNRGTGTSGYREYARDVSLRIEGKAEVHGSADVPFRGDGSRWNPEDMLLAALAECHLLSYLHACVTRGVIVTDYVDDARGTLRQEGNGGRFDRIVLRPRVTVAEAGMISDAVAAHDDAHEWCFIANSLNVDVEIIPDVRVSGDEGPAAGA